MTILGPFDFSGGWNTKAGPYDVPPNAVVDGQNMELVYGRYAKKKGNTLWITADSPMVGAVIGLAYFQGVLVASDGTKVATASAISSGTWTDITGGSFTGTNNIWMEPLNNILAIGSDGGVAGKWTGSGSVANLGGSPPNGCVCGKSVNNYLFMANNTTNPSRVQWSAINDPETWPAANFVDVLKGDVATKAFGVQALFPFGEDLLIFKTDSISRLYTAQISGTLGPLITVTQQYGCAGPACVDRLPDGRIAFIGYNNHIYIYDGNSFDDISNPPAPRSNIQPTLNALPFKTAGFNQGFLKVYNARNQIWCSYPFTYTTSLGTSTVGVIFIYDIESRTWLPPYLDHNVKKAVNYINGSEYMITSGNKRLYYEDNGDANNDVNKQLSDFNGYFTKSFAFGANAQQFIPRSVFFGLSCGNLSAKVAWSANGFNNPTLSNVFAISGSAGERKKVIPITTAATNWNTGQFKFEGTASNQPFMCEPIYISDEMESQ